MDEHAFPPTGFAVAWLGCTLQRTEIFDLVCDGYKCVIFVICKVWDIPVLVSVSI